MNAPDRFELFLLGDDEKKCIEAADTPIRVKEIKLTLEGTPNSSVFTINKEDHTLANMLRSYLLKDSHVLFAGYKIPHPLFATLELRVQTDGEITPKDALVGCCKTLVNDLQIMSREFTKEYELRKMISGDTGIAR
ncbi:DNA-directed RNA polymerase II subunit RPB11 [Golovinomyces cichoracearum]|uniref:DNA-directed RNA polymerase II subunit RPB11 n=1 Tax=Golovinomyces cichoracearum TaxID=62708 RepID=A0A420IBW5_9PEZI|nr:DNA-directed RNA polymerase II subunit RPB11 [Golovinomyces cichoracearum]